MRPGRRKPAKQPAIYGIRQHHRPPRQRRTQDRRPPRALRPRRPYSPLGRRHGLRKPLLREGSRDEGNRKPGARLCRGTSRVAPRHHRLAAPAPRLGHQSRVDILHPGHREGDSPRRLLPHQAGRQGDNTAARVSSVPLRHRRQRPRLRGEPAHPKPRRHL